MVDQCHTSTPFVRPDSTKNSNNDARNDVDELDGSIFDQSAVLSNKERSSLEISSIPTTSKDSSRVKDTSHSESNISDDISSSTLDKGFIQSSLSDNNIASNTVDILLEDSAIKQMKNPDTSETSLDKSTQEDSEKCQPATEQNKSENTDTIVNPHKNKYSKYIDDGCVPPSKKNFDETRKRKRLTLAERRAKEALESFGGCGLDGVLQKTVSFKEKLQKQKEALEKAQENATFDEPKVKRSRLETAKAETELLFKGIPFGKPPDDDKKDSKLSQQNSKEGNERKLTRLEKAKLETMQSFGGSSLDELFKPKSQKNEPVEEVNKENEAAIETADEDVITE